MRAFLLALPDSVVPSVMFADVLDALYETDVKRRGERVRGLLARLSPPRRNVLRVLLAWAKKVVASQQHLRPGDAAAFLGPALARPVISDGMSVADADSQSYALMLSLLELGDEALEATISGGGGGGGGGGMTSSANVPLSALAAMGRSSVSLIEDVGGRVSVNEEQIKGMQEKIDSLTRQLDHSRKSETSLKAEVERVKKENAELKRRNHQLTKQVEQWKANSIMEMY